MALGTSNITTTAVGSYIGNASHIVKTLCQDAGINPWAFYGPGIVDTTGSASVVDFTAGSSNFKLGDFRAYDKDASATSVGGNTSYTWGPNAQEVQMELDWYGEAFNVLYCNNNARYVTVLLYDTALNRTNMNEGAAIYSNTQAITFVSNTPLTGHTRQQTEKIPAGFQSIDASVYTTGYPSSKTLYADLFFSDAFGNRLIGFGNAQSDGWVNITLTKLVAPYTTIGGDVTPPAGFDEVAPFLKSTASNACSAPISQISQSIGGTSLPSFYLAMIGFESATGDQYSMKGTARVKCTIGGTTWIVANSVTFTGNNAVTVPSYTFSSPSHSWAAGEIGYITIDNVSYSGGDWLCL